MGGFLQCGSGGSESAGPLGDAVSVYSPRRCTLRYVYTYAHNDLTFCVLRRGVLRACRAREENIDDMSACSQPPRTRPPRRPVLSHIHAPQPPLKPTTKAKGEFVQYGFAGLETSAKTNVHVFRPPVGMYASYPLFIGCLLGCWIVRTLQCSNRATLPYL